ncbi:MAG: PilT/PilU family type 4a pilus ATPase [Candidatus Eisenbacteria bacterium]|uniref:PilT/PilU family type 4a pilus ATPase n=1 Tax=Eiseniibacteriota bacterium TaxID=2212470 RepID=A0A948WEX1_UNCEI|nr:PilT/PilU family type 4a pilus ATPase [Candidatus Eisenbacteria bacterium]MBU1950726.1 PilT/PilU family type 4a pilus ATPase [Candidatus Eisenbacteria bacterium]MBU2693158.1 PilT/PilU family type 4a pilus ATPase [Candidatus Eisenbacteria bacterium]
MARIDSIFKLVNEQGASDLHVGAGSQPRLRVYGEIHPIDSPPMDDNQVRELVYEILTSEQTKLFEKDHDLDFAYEVPGLLRVRANIFEDIRGMNGAFRILPNRVFTMDELELPRQLSYLLKFQRGLIVVTGPPGTGKSTTQAALLDHINRTQRRHIITIEDPVEYVHTSNLSLVHQREVGRHTSTFSSALRAALREDPNIILVGEMRDPETVALAITAAETGQLVLGTLHTSSAPQTVDRILDTFPANRQDQVRAMLAESLRGVIAQKLLPRSDKDGMVAAVEVLIGNRAVSNLIREKKTHQLEGTLQAGRKSGMQTMLMAVEELLQAKKISPETAALNGVMNTITRSQRPAA